MNCALEDYALIGDCETAALVSRRGSIDWLCWPRFDSPSCFAALLGTPQHGRWLVEPVADDARVSRRYRGHTLILETRFVAGDAAATLIDFMPPRGANNSDLVRIVRGGRLRMRTELILRFDYGRTVPWVNHLEDGTLRGRRLPVARHVESADLRSDRWDCRRAYDFTAGVDRRLAQLGLPVLLGP